MIKTIIMIICILFVCWSNSFSRSQKAQLQNIQSPTIAILPHFMFETQKLDEFYNSIHSSLAVPSKIILISPNHFRAWSYAFESIPNDITTLCFRNSCINARSLTTWSLVWQGIFPDNRYTRQSTSKQNSNNYINDHGLGEHFQFIEKYYSGIIVYPLLIDIYKTQWTDQIINYLSWMIDNQTLVIFSVDFSHHNNITWAKIHDRKTEYILWNSNTQAEYMQTEVDCRNCLYISKIIWNNRWLLPKLIYRDDQCSFIWNTACIDNTSRNFYLYSTGFTPPNGIILWAVGDIIYDRWVEEKYPDELSLKRHFATYYQKSDPKLNPEYNYHRKWFGLDVVIGNMEWPITSWNYCSTNLNNFVHFNNKNDITSVLQEIGITHLMTSNNHSLDCGLGARRKSNQIIKQSGIKSYGLVNNPNPSSWSEPRNQHNELESKDLENKVRKIHWTIASWTIRWISYSLIWRDQTKFTIDRNIQCQIISSLSGIVIITPHRGIEYVTWHNPIQETLAKHRIDCWADVIIGTHPHVIREIEYYKHKPIIYSLGNFLFDQSFWDTGTGMQVYLDIDGSGNSILENEKVVSY